MTDINYSEKGSDIEIVYSEKAQKDQIKIGDLTDMEMIITDDAGEMYQENTTLSNGWTQSDLKNIVTETLMLCDNPPKSIVAKILGKPLMN